MPFPIRSLDDCARALGFDAGRITNMLLLRATHRAGLRVVVLPSNRSADICTVAEWVGFERTKMATQQELARVLGHPPTGISPFGAGSARVLLDKNLMEYPTVLVGAGQVGVEIEVSPRDLQS